MKDKLIWCNTKEKLAKVIAKLEKDGYTADSVDRMWNSYGDKVTVRVRKEFKDITFASRSWYEGSNFGTPITADEFLGKNKRPSIVIFQRGRNVIAKDVATGNEGIAKCSPNDEFNFHTGASIALARLMSKVPATGVLNPDVRAEWTKLLGITEIPEKVFTDADRNFKVGDYVTLKEGLAVGKKYGALTLYSGRMYECANGKRLEVETATFNECDGMYHYRCKAADGNYFYYTEAMLDKWNEGKIHEGDTVKVINTDLNHSSYVKWVGEHISDPYMAARFCFGSPSTDEKYKVIKIAKHGRNDNDLAYIEEIDGISYNRCYLIEVKGLEKV